MNDNPELNLAYEYLTRTNKNVFLTGKAGTGKTTFLRNLTKTINKRHVVLAPTGIAALQAGGTTIHSFFQLPFHIYIPGTDVKTRKFRKEKINLIRSLDLIIIDEISMVRCDILDEIDFLLRRFRYNARNKPFGGVQMLFIGDLSQLPPVTTETDCEELRQYYDNFYFFSAKALQNSSYITITLQHIYRQSDREFINILNAVREDKLTPDIVETLNKRYVADINKNIPENYIVLCTHNQQADSINNIKLDQIDRKEVVYTADVQGDFLENFYPNSFELKLKEDAQVMFLKNDYNNGASGKKRYYNGKIGKIKELHENHIVVRCPEDDEDITVERYTWESIKYDIDKKTKNIEANIVGTFSQFPLRLAWAVTIHKSQGLTFDKVVINSNKAFSHGQVYVALSRCRSLDGIILTAKFNTNSVMLDKNITMFNTNSLINPPNETTLHTAQQNFLIENIITIFDFSDFTTKITKLAYLIRSSVIGTFPKIAEKCLAIIDRYQTDIAKVSTTFVKWLNNFNRPTTLSTEQIDKCIARCLKAKEYYAANIDFLNDLFLDLINIELDNAEDNITLKELIISLSVEKEIKCRFLQFFNEKFESIGFMELKNNLLAQGNSLPLVSIIGDMAKETPTQIASKPKQTSDNLQSKDKQETSSDIEDEELFNALRLWRAKVAKEKNIPAYYVISQKGLIALSNEKPTTKSEFLHLKYLGKKTFENYGEAILEIIKEHTKEE